MREIKKGNTILARQIYPNDFKRGLNFFSQDEEFVQVGIWGHYEQDKELGKHFHNAFERSAMRTYEMIYVITGSLHVEIYDLDKLFVEEFELRQGEILILLECGHGYTVSSEDTTVLEVKNGPFMGVDTDKTLF